MSCFQSPIDVLGTETRSERRPFRGAGGGVLPYFSYIGMCCLIGYGFQGAQSLNRVFFLAL